MEYRDVVDRAPMGLNRKDWELLEKVCTKHHCKTIVEIGSQDGCSSVLLASMAKNAHGKLYCIDKAINSTLMGNLEFFSVKSHVKLIEQDSHKLDPSKVLGDDRIDLLFIDGDHSPEGVFDDYHSWGKYIRDGGCVAFHDFDSPAFDVTRGVFNVLRNHPELVFDCKTHDTRDKKGKLRQGTIVFRKEPYAVNVRTDETQGT